MDIAAIEEALVNLWGAGTGVESAVRVVQDSPQFQFNEEAELVADAGLKRQCEFAAGRECAHACLEKMGLDEGAILVGLDRVPRWPNGVSGSISHSKGLCIASLVKTVYVSAIGVDIERVDRLHERLWETVFVDDEIAFLKETGSDVQLATLIFSAKEAFYKMQYPVTGTWVGFQDVSVSVNREKGEWVIHLLKDFEGDFLSKGSRFMGRFVFTEGYVVTGIGR